MAKAATKGQTPVWWRDLNKNEVKAAVFVYWEAKTDAIVVISEIKGFPLPKLSSSGDFITYLSEQLEEQLTNSEFWAKVANPPIELATIYATRAYGSEKVNAALAGLAWIQVATQALEEKATPIIPIVSAIEALPADATVEEFTKVLSSATAESLKMQPTQSNDAILTKVLDIWMKKLIGKGLSDLNGPYVLEMGLSRANQQYIWAPSMMPTQTIDRAARSSRGWSFPQDDAPTFQDANNRHAVAYFEDGLTQEALREGVMQLNPRTADVWRLVTATILESWGEGEREPPRVWLDARQLCDAMGFKKHHKGGHRPENVAIAARALVDLERFHITIPYGARQYPADANGKRKAVTVQARAQHRVLAVMGKEEIKQLFGAEWLPLRWLVTAGEWIKSYPREQFAPLFRALVELPGTYTPDLWAKALGTELVWQYRQDEGKRQTQRVETMLKQACVLEEARAEKNKARARDNFEKALDALQKHGVCTAWEYNSPDIDRVEATQRGWFDLWLQTRVVVTPPPEVTKALEGVAVTKKRHRRRLKTT